MEILKNNIYTVRIVNIGDDGAGIGYLCDVDEKNSTETDDTGDAGGKDGKGKHVTVFVKNTAIGDVAEVLIMKVKKNIAYGKLVKLIVPSPSRVEPRCENSSRCGGCTLQHISYEKQLEYKWNKVKECLRRIGKIDEPERFMEPVYGMENPWFYRNKAQFPVRLDKAGNVVAGFFAERTHSIIPTEKCYIQTEINEEIVKRVCAFLQENHICPYNEEMHTGLVRHILTRKGFQTGELMVCLVINGDKLPFAEKLVDSLTKLPGMTSICININKEKTNRILGSVCRTLWGNDYITDCVGDIKYRISPLSFYQVNPVQMEVLYGKALEYANLTGEETVWDMYCGIGTISLFLAKSAKQVYGVEIVPQAIHDAKINAEMNHMDNVKFYVGSAETVVPQIYKKGGAGAYADVVVVDPPRKGCDLVLLETLVSMSPKRIVYVSCDPATLARDVSILSEKGYSLCKVAVVDQFCHSGHVESVVLLSHKSPDSIINVKVEFGDGEGKVPLDAIAERAKKYQPRPKITYKMIQEYVEKKYGFRVHTAYIAEVKRSLGLTMYDAPNAVEELKQPRKHPPKEKVEAIKDALKYFEVI